MTAAITPRTVAAGVCASNTDRNITNLANQPANGGSPASENRNALMRTAKPGAEAREAGGVGAEAAVAGDLRGAGAARERDDDREGTEVHRAVDEEVDDHGLERRISRATVRRDRERNEHETALRDRRVGQHPDDVRLAQRSQVPE